MYPCQPPASLTWQERQVDTSEREKKINNPQVPGLQGPTHAKHSEQEQEESRKTSTMPDHDVHRSPLKGLSLEVKCPISNVSMCGSCDSHGGIITSQYGVKLTIPEGAIKNKDSIEVYIAADLYGPFVLPSHCHTDLASPYYWIWVTGIFKFEKPVQVEFEHFAIVNACDPSHYQLLTCEDYDKTHIMQPVNHDFGFKTQDNKLLCTFQTYRFCSYCLFHDCETNDQEYRIGAFFLKPENYQYLNNFTVEIWLSFTTECCLRRNNELFKNNHMILDKHCSHIYDAPCSKESESYFLMKYDRSIDGWLIDHSRSLEIKTNLVNFNNHYPDNKTLLANEEASLFPPRFSVNVTKKSVCEKDLNTAINVTLYKIEGVKTTNSIFFKLFVSASPMSIQNLTTTSKDNSPLSIGRHFCDKNEPKMRELVTYATKISAQWKVVALRLKIPDHIVSTIDHNYQHIEDKCVSVFQKWLDRSETPPCWCHFIQTLCDVGLDKVAKEATKHLKECHSHEHESDKTLTATGPEICFKKPPTREAHVVARGLPSTSETEVEDEHVPADFRDLFRYLRPLQYIEEKDLLYFITCLLPTESAKEVIFYVRHGDECKEDKIKRICEQFVKEKDPSWTKVYNALIQSECYERAELVKACFL